ncbi:hypothetical protein THUN1379_26770 [Paludibacterium sp. THUN1379]|nr:hypothetical protein THUN1379_26770 [Paludibacterium sp. THUN1379]
MTTSSGNRDSRDNSKINCSEDGGRAMVGIGAFSRSGEALLSLRRARGIRCVPDVSEAVAAASSRLRELSWV